MNFKAHKSYQGLLKQAQAMANLIESQKTALLDYRQKDYSHSELAVAGYKKQIAELKEENEQLTHSLIELAG